MEFKTIGSQYRPLPFWSWNERLSLEETRRQIISMEEAGIGGYFMHARGGLQTEYMGEEWFQNVAVGIEEAAARHLHAWAYDENGWPSGFGDGRVNGRGIDYQQKYLRMGQAPALEIPEERVIFRSKDTVFYYDVNPYYVDTLDGEVIATFIEEIYEPYYEKFGQRLDGFFTDEPQISRNGIPWSFVLPQEYQKAYGDELLSHLTELFLPVGDYQRTRVRFWKLVTELFSRNYCKQIYDWCHAHGVKFTGHLVLEETLHSQLTSNGACMPHYEYFDIPGMDWLGRPIFRCLTAMQVASAAAQMGKSQILSETFAMCGHNVGHDELKRNYEWMMVRGINLLCQHLEGYSLRGIRKRDYPPAMYEQQPWWGDYRPFNDAMSRIGMLLAKGEIFVDTLVIHPQTTAWICFDHDKCEGMQFYNDRLLDIMDELERKHILYHLGDEILMERHAYVEDGALVIGKMRYTKIILPPHIAFLENTERLLAEFVVAGGQIVTPAELPPCKIVDDSRITYTRREFPDEHMVIHYFVNSTEEPISTTVHCTGQVLDLATGELSPFDGRCDLPRWGSMVVIDDGTPLSLHQEMPVAPTVSLADEWQVVDATENALTLDRCTYYFDGELQEENGYILNVASRAIELGRPVDIRCCFTVFADALPTQLWLACETPEKFEITVNGCEIATMTDHGYFCDRSFRRLDISGYMKTGKNVIETRTRFTQSNQVYEHLERAKHFESEKNKLTYDQEIEAMYLIGSFGVRCDGAWEEVDHYAAFFTGNFVLTTPPKAVTLSHLERQGYPFFAGALTLERTIVIKEDEPIPSLQFEKRGLNVVRVSLDGSTQATLLWGPYKVTLPADLTPGEHRIRLTLVNNLRNLLGPHHHVAGELLGVAPPHFYGEPCIWNDYRGGHYTERYCFVEMGMQSI